jgi:serine/threonine-protein kinase
MADTSSESGARERQLYQACAELERRLRAGEDYRVESLLSAQPAWAGDEGAVVALVYAEFVTREQLGQRPSREELYGRFPQWREALDKMFEVYDGLSPLPLPWDARATVCGAAAARTSEEFPRRMGSYELLARIGSGGMGIVYRARQPRLNRIVALKVMAAGAHDDEEASARFRAEARAVARLQHPNVVQIFEVGEYAGRSFFALEFVGGGSLDGKLDREGRRPLPAREAAQLVEALARAMQAAHECGIVHRDLKPANVLLTAEGTPKLTDFGLAKKIDEVGRTQTGAILGTPSYMAPEQAEGKTEEVGPLSDVYALGAILYECLTGRPPFNAATVLETLNQVRRDDPVPPRKLNPAAPRDLETICLKCLRKEPRKRYPSAGALAEDLRRFLSGESILARRAGSPERLWRWCRRNPGRTTLAGAITLAVLALGIGAGWRAIEQASRRGYVEAELAGATEGLERDDRVAAHKHLGSAAGRLGPEGPPDLRQRLEELQANAELASRLDEIRVRRFAAGLSRPSFDKTFADYQETFHDPQRLADRVARSPLRQPLLAALDDWACVCESLARQEQHFAEAEKLRGLRDRLLGLARRKDPASGELANQVRDAGQWSDRRRVKGLAERAAKEDLPTSLVVLLAELLDADGETEAAVRLLEAAHGRAPGDFSLNMFLGFLLLRAEPGRALPYCQAAVALKPDSAAALINMGSACMMVGDVPRAIRHFEKVLDDKDERKRQDVLALVLPLANLAGLLCEDGGHRDVGRAADLARRALRLDDRCVPALVNLGRALTLSGPDMDRKEAIQLLKQAIEIEPNHVAALNNLGLALSPTDREKAAQCFRDALRIDPDHVPALVNLAHAECANNQWGKGIWLFRRAFALQPINSSTLVDLGHALCVRDEDGDREEAIWLFRRALRERPDFAPALNNLGRALYERNRAGDREEALRLYQQAAGADPNFVPAHNNLGQLYLDGGDFANALTAFEHAHDLLKQAGVQAPPDEWVRSAKEMIDLERRLGPVPPEPGNAAEALGLARVCYFKKRYVAATHFYSLAFQKQPEIAADPRSDHRYAAACSAALGAAGVGEGANQLGTEQRKQLRSQALAWLRADLGAWDRVTREAVTSGPMVRRAIRHWAENPQLASVRQPDSLRKLSAAELKEWFEFWADADALRRRLLVIEAAGSLGLILP